MTKRGFPKEKKFQIRSELLARIWNDEDLLMKIAKECGSAFSTVKHSWVRHNHPKLTQVAALKVLCAELNMTEDELQEEVPMGDTTTVL